MNVVFTRRAREHIAHRFTYSVENFGPKVAERTFARVDA